MVNLILLAALAQAPVDSPPQPSKRMPELPGKTQPYQVAPRPTPRPDLRQAHNPPRGQTGRLSITAPRPPVRASMSTAAAMVAAMQVVTQAAMAEVTAAVTAAGENSPLASNGSSTTPSHP